MTRTNVESIKLLTEALNILQASPETAKMSVDAMPDMLMAKKIDLVRKMHPYTLTPPKSDNDRWQTYYKDSTGKRKCLKAGNEEELLLKLADIYIDSKNIDKLTFEKLFHEWLAYKSAVVNSPNTIKRHEQHYAKYFAASPLASKKIRRLDSLTLESEFNSIIRENNLTRKEWINIKTIPKGMFEYALRKQYITKNPMDGVAILVKFKQINKKSGKTQTYNSEELEELNRYLDAKFTETGDTSFLAVKLNFLLGLRCGELVALRWEDLEDNHLHIVREEVRNQVDNTLSIAEHTKTYNDRYVVLIPKALDILKRIPRTGDYIFMRNGSRITARQIAYVLEKFAERHGVRTKSTHKMRKTYASMLAANGVPLDAIRELLGHSDLQTTLGYIYNPLTDAKTAELIEKAL